MNLVTASTDTHDCKVEIGGCHFGWLGLMECSICLAFLSHFFHRQFVILLGSSTLGNAVDHWEGGTMARKSKYFSLLYPVGIFFYIIFFSCARLGPVAPLLHLPFLIWDPLVILNFNLYNIYVLYRLIITCSLSHFRVSGTQLFNSFIGKFASFSSFSQFDHIVSFFCGRSSTFCDFC